MLDKDLPPSNPSIREEQETDIFYNFAVTPWLAVGADLQVINPGRAKGTAVFPGVRTVPILSQRGEQRQGHFLAQS